jgi:MFS family permease
MTTSSDGSSSWVRRPRSPHAVTLVLFLAAASVPTPLYRLYQQEWEFSPLMLTVIFAIYALALLATLLVFGSTSDRLGRRSVILAALALEVVALVLFLVAPDVEWLLVARLIQGIATGLATTSLGAALLDIDRERGALINALATIAGTAFGAVSSGLLARYAPAPLHLGYILLLASFILQTIRTVYASETAAMRPAYGGSLKPMIAVPAQARGAFLAVTPVNLALWALLGFYLALMPSLIGTVAGPAAAWMGGLAVAALMAGAAAAILVMRRYPAASALIFGSGALMVGLLGVLAGANLTSPALLLASSALAGIGFGAAYFGALGSVAPLAEPHERGALMAAFYIEGYLAYALPAIAAGFLAQQVGLLETANLFGVALILLVGIAMILALAQRRDVHRRTAARSVLKARWMRPRPRPKKPRASPPWKSRNS